MTVEERSVTPAPRSTQNARPAQVGSGHHGRGCDRRENEVGHFEARVIGYDVKGLPDSLVISVHGPVSQIDFFADHSDRVLDRSAVKQHRRSDMMNIGTTFFGLSAFRFLGSTIQVGSGNPVFRGTDRGRPKKHLTTQMNTGLSKVNRIDRGARHFLGFLQGGMDSIRGFRKSTISPLRIPSLGREAMPTMLNFPFSVTSPTKAFALEVPISTAP